jgi:hypothetical protein
MLSCLVVDQLAGGFCDQLRPLSLAALEHQQALAEDEAVEQEGLGVGVVRR